MGRRKDRKERRKKRRKNREERRKKRKVTREARRDKREERRNKRVQKHLDKAASGAGVDAEYYESGAYRNMTPEEYLDSLAYDEEGEYDMPNDDESAPTPGEGYDMFRGATGESVFHAPQFQGYPGTGIEWLE